MSYIYPSDINRIQFEKIRSILEGRKAKTSFLIIDTQSVKNSDTAEQTGAAYLRGSGERWQTSVISLLIQMVYRMQFL